MIELLRYVEHHPVWTLIYLVFAWWPACSAIASFGPFVISVQPKRGSGD